MLMFAKEPLINAAFADSQFPHSNQISLETGSKCECCRHPLSLNLSAPDAHSPFSPSSTKLL